MPRRRQREETHARTAATQSRREERACRILDAAAELILRYGYNKTTLDDVAQRAGVAKGTLYLHWNTRDELFRALMKRERLESSRDFLAHIGKDPSQITLRGMFKYAALSLLRRPLIKAVMTRNANVIGKIVQDEHSGHPEKREIFELYLDFLVQRNLVRRDLSPHTQSNMVLAVFLGFFVMESWMPDKCALSDEEMADLIADTVASTLERGRTIPPDEIQVASLSFLDYVNRMTEMEKENFRQELL